MADRFYPRLRLGRHNKQLAYIQTEDDPTDTDELAIVFLGDGAEHRAALVVRLINAAVSSRRALIPPARSDSQPAGGQDPA